MLMVENEDQLRTKNPPLRGGGIMLT
jgi:hypothetical protein